MKVITILPGHLYAEKQFHNGRWRIVRADCRTMAEIAVLPRYIIRGA